MAFCLSSHAQIITTIAGTGTGGWGGDGGTATSAELNYPNSLLIDAAGNIYIDETLNNRIRMINTSGVIVTIAGTGVAAFSGDGGPATAAEINNPSGLAMDAAGNLYFGDLYNQCVRKISPAIGGTISTIAGTPGVSGYSGNGYAATAAAFSQPYGLAFDTYGNLYIADQLNDVVRKITAHAGSITASDTVTAFAGIGVATYGGDGGPAISAGLNTPNCLFMDTHNNLFISDNGNQRIRKVNASGIISTFAGNGSLGYSGDGGPAVDATMEWPAAMDTDSSGNFYFCDAGGSRIRKVSVSGIISTICGNGTAGYSGDGGPAIAAEINLPNGIATDPSGNIYIADEYNDRVRKIGIGPNHPPVFVLGDTQSMEICIPEAPIPIDSQLAINDPDAGQTETWSLTTAPLHGTAVVSYTTTSTGGVLIPTGLTYAADGGYTGMDMFKVSVTDGIATTTLTMNVMINLPPNPGVISGPDSVCPGLTVDMSETVAAGIWSSSNTTITTINSLGVATGIIPGHDTIIYTVINECGITAAIYPFTVSDYMECGTGVKTSQVSPQGINIFPNPNTGAFTVNITSAMTGQAHVVIRNIIGATVDEFTTLTNQPTPVNLNEPAGVYYIDVTTSSERWMERVGVVK